MTIHKQNRLISRRALLLFRRVPTIGDRLLEGILQIEPESAPFRPHYRPADLTGPGVTRPRADICGDREGAAGWLERGDRRWIRFGGGFQIALARGIIWIEV